jgi:hypothetical protein
LSEHRSSCANSTWPGAQPGSGGRPDSSCKAAGQAGSAVKDQLLMYSKGHAHVFSVSNDGKRPLSLPRTTPHAVCCLLSTMGQCSLTEMKTSWVPDMPQCWLRCIPWLPACRAPHSCKPAPHERPAQQACALWHSRCQRWHPSQYTPGRTASEGISQHAAVIDMQP